MGATATQDLMGAQERSLEEQRLKKERLRLEEQSQSVFEIRKLFKFGTEFQDFVKKDPASRPVSAYTSGLMEQISDKFNKIVSQVNDK